MNTRIDADLLPWSPEAEQALLGALLLDPDAIGQVTRLSREDFFDVRHRLIWSAMLEQAARRHPIDVVTVFEALRERRETDDDSLSYLNELANSVASSANIGRHAEIVLEKALRRAIIAAADKALALAKEPGPADEVLDRVASLFAGIERVRAASVPRKLGELVLCRLEHWQALADGTTSPGTPTGIARLDEALGGGLKPAKVIVVAARPSVGKTSLAGQIGLNIAAQGRTVLMLSMEMPAGDVVDRGVSNLGRVNLERLTTGRFEADDWSRVAGASDAAARLPFFVDDQPSLSLLDIRAKARQVQQREGLFLVIVDYLQLCASAGSFDKRHHQIEQISRGLKTLAKELGVCVMVLSQLRRERDSEPELDHLKESGAIEEDADVVVLLHPMGHEADGSTLILAKVPKNRQGRRGRLALSFDGKTQRWQRSAGDVSRRSGADSRSTQGAAR